MYFGQVVGVFGPRIVSIRVQIQQREQFFISFSNYKTTLFSLAKRHFNG